MKTQGSRLLQVTSRRAVALSIRTVSRSAPVSGCLAKEGPNPLPPCTWSLPAAERSLQRLPLHQSSLFSRCQGLVQPLRSGVAAGEGLRHAGSLHEAEVPRAARAVSVPSGAAALQPGAGPSRGHVEGHKRHSMGPVGHGDIPFEPGDSQVCTNVGSSPELFPFPLVRGHLDSTESIPQLLPSPLLTPTPTLERGGWIRGEPEAPEAVLEPWGRLGEALLLLLDPIPPSAGRATEAPVAGAGPCAPGERCAPGTSRGAELRPGSCGQKGRREQPPAAPQNRRQRHCWRNGGEDFIEGCFRTCFNGTVEMQVTSSGSCWGENPDFFLFCFSFGT